MSTRTYFDELCDLELENVALWLSKYPFRERWGRDLFFDGIEKYTNTDNPLRRACASLLRHETMYSLPFQSLLASVDLFENIKFEASNVREFENEQLIQPFLDGCTSLTSIQLYDLWFVDYTQVWCKRLMDTIGKQLTVISVWAKTGSSGTLKILALISKNLS